MGGDSSAKSSELETSVLNSEIVTRIYASPFFLQALFGRIESPQYILNPD